MIPTTTTTTFMVLQVLVLLVFIHQLHLESTVQIKPEFCPQFHLETIEEIPLT
jgi:hypothetical protein